MRGTLVSISIVSVLLASCIGQAASLEYDLKITAKDTAERALLLQAVERVAKRKSVAVETHAIIVTSPTGNDAGKLTVKMKDKEKLERLKGLLELPFAFELKLQGEPTKENLKIHEWLSTNITEVDLASVQVLQNGTNVSIELIFTNDGHKKLEEVFTNNVGKNLGIFVGNVLMSGITIGKDAPKEQIVISGVPSLAQANFFVDDVMVGLKVKFTPRS